MPTRLITHRRGRWLAVLFALLAVGTVTLTRTSASAAGSLDGTTACSVPVGYTYDTVSRQLGGPCNPGGFASVYHLRLPVDNLAACTVPLGFTYDSSAQVLSQCAIDSFAIKYHLKVPVAGIWVCTVPPGFHADAAVNELSRCNPSGFALTYHLAAG